MMFFSVFVFTGLFVMPGSAVLRTRDSRRGTFCSRQDRVSRNHVIAERDVKDEISCTIECVAEPRCRSVNFEMTSINSGARCQLNNATRFSAKTENYGKNLDYNHMFDSDDIPVSCSQIKVSVPSSTNGYYLIRNPSALCLPRLVYCDMENDGGGWTLVASISNTNNNHLQTNKVNCMNDTLCVEYTTTNIQTRKIGDDDIRTMAEMEGIFRVNVLKSTPYRVFFKIPSGAHYFDSSCDGNSCPRIITSHSYPYVWESSCQGTNMGYAFGYTPVGMSCYHGKDCWGNNGIYYNLNGLLFVK